MSISGTAILVTAFTAAIATFVLLPALSSSRLALVEQLVDRGYTTPSISADTLQSLREQPAPPLIFDVRKPEEYAVSHLPRAINISPTLTAAEFVQRHGQIIEGQQLVFYCSVGQRSSALADRLHGLSEQLGASEIVNLRGGIFRWASRGLPMQNQQGITSAIHPYNKLAATLLPPEAKTTTAVKP